MKIKVNYYASRIDVGQKKRKKKKLQPKRTRLSISHLFR